MTDYRIETRVKNLKISDIVNYLRKKFNKHLYLTIIAPEVYEDFDFEYVVGSEETYMAIVEEGTELYDTASSVVCNPGYVYLNIKDIKYNVEYKVNTIYSEPINGIVAILDGPLVDGCTRIDPTKINIIDKTDKENLTEYIKERIPLYDLKLSEEEIKRIALDLLNSGDPLRIRLEKVLEDNDIL